MEIFINECSLTEQFSDHRMFYQSIKEFLSSIQLLVKQGQKPSAYTSAAFYYYTSLKNVHFQTALKSNPEINLAFTQNFQLLNAKNWEDSMMHDPNISYTYLKRNYANTSVAEIAERNIVVQNIKGLLLNFKDSQFGNEIQIEVLKQEKTEINVDCAFDSKSVNEWLIKNRFIKPEEKYDESSFIAPTDIQTVLRDNTVFELTTYLKNNGRNVYRRIGTEELWVVDGTRRHAGNKAHIEIFNERTKKHLGTSLYNEININPSHKKKRTINLG